MQALKRSNYDAEPMLRSCGISISNGFTQVEGRVLPAPKVFIIFQLAVISYCWFELVCFFFVNCLYVSFL